MFCCGAKPQCCVLTEEDASVESVLCIRALSVCFPDAASTEETKLIPVRLPVLSCYESCGCSLALHHNKPNHHWVVAVLL